MKDVTFLIERLMEDPTIQNLRLAQQYASLGRVRSEVRQELKDRLSEIGINGSGVATFELSAELQSLDPEERDKAILIHHFQNTESLSETAVITKDLITVYPYRLFQEDQSTGQFHSQADPLPGLYEKTRFVKGISLKDAQWFCAWLASRSELQQEGKVYDYRLPTAEEIRQFPAREEDPELIPWTQEAEVPGNALRIVREEIPQRYDDLVSYLARGRWREADQETFQIMLDVAGQRERGYLLPDDLRRFPCDHLRILDRLWVKFSGGLFGFSVQKRIYAEDNPLVGGFYQDGFHEFATKVRWRAEGSYVSYEDLVMDLTAPYGHLPWVVVVAGGWWCSSLAWRLVNCSIR